MQRLILRSFQSPGDVLMLTAAVRDLHRAHPGKFQTDVRTSADGLWEHNPNITRLREGEAGVQQIDMQYPLIHQSGERPYHFIHGYVQFLEQQLHLAIPITRFKGDVFLAEDEKRMPATLANLGIDDGFWIVIAGGKFDFTAKWWNPASYQAVVDHFRARVQFVQCGEAGHWHPPLQGVTNLVGKTSIREFVRLMYHAAGVLCPVTFAMHLAAAVPTKVGVRRARACVVVAGGRESPHWEAYPQHQFLHTVGALPCCDQGGCWKSRCQIVGDGDEKDRKNLCEMPVQVTPELRIPRCMEMLTPQDVIRRVDVYLEGQALRSALPVARPRSVLAEAPTVAAVPPAVAATSATSLLIKFRHGLGDAVQLTTVLQHLKHYHPDSQVDVAALIGKHSAFHGLCRQVFVLDRDPLPGPYDRILELSWDECHMCFAHSPSTKAERCLQEVFRLAALPQLCTYAIRRGDKATQLARIYLGQICAGKPLCHERFPAVLIHYEGNTSSDQKNIPVAVVRQLCDKILGAGYVPVILDWDRRTPLADGITIHNPNTQMELWGWTGTGDAEVLGRLDGTLFPDDRRRQRSAARGRRNFHADHRRLDRPPSAPLFRACRQRAASGPGKPPALAASGPARGGGLFSRALPLPHLSGPRSGPGFGRARSPEESRRQPRPHAQFLDSQQ